MGKIYSAPLEVGDYKADYTKPWKEVDEAADQWIQKLIGFVKANSDCEYAGEIIRTPMGDGYAQYVVFSVKPVVLIHIPTGDAWNFPYANRWTGKDIKDMVKRERAMKELFGG